MSNDHEVAAWLACGWWSVCPGDVVRARCVYKSLLFMCIVV